MPVTIAQPHSQVSVERLELTEGGVREGCASSFWMASRGCFAHDE